MEWRDRPNLTGSSPDFLRPASWTRGNIACITKSVSSQLEQHLLISFVFCKSSLYLLHITRHQRPDSGEISVQKQLFGHTISHLTPSADVWRVSRLSDSGITYLLGVNQEAVRQEGQHLSAKTPNWIQIARNKQQT